MQAQVQAWRLRDTLRAIEFGPVISGGNNDHEAWKPWTHSASHGQSIKRVKNPSDPLAFLIVKSMLLTGFEKTPTQAAR